MSEQKITREEIMSERTNGVFSPNGWKLEPLSRFVDDHKWAANRCRNIVAALENLLTQIGDGWCQSEFVQRLKAAKEVYEYEMQWHLGQLKNVLRPCGEK